MGECIFLEGWNAIKCKEYQEATVMIEMIERNHEIEGNEVYNGLKETIRTSCHLGGECAHRNKYETALQKQKMEELVGRI